MALSGDRLKVFVQGLGYSASPQAIADAAREARDGVRLTVDEVCKMLSALATVRGHFPSSIH